MIAYSTVIQSAKSEQKQGFCCSSRAQLWLNRMRTILSVLKTDFGVLAQRISVLGGF